MTTDTAAAAELAAIRQAIPEEDAKRMAEEAERRLAPADDLVTEEMVDKALAAEKDFIAPRSCMKAAIRAVAPMIAAAEREVCWQDAMDIRHEAVAAEREAIAKMVLEYYGNEEIAAAIRARGETP